MVAPSCVVTFDLTLLYILFITARHFPFIFVANNLCQRPFLQPVSKACLKSIKQLNNFDLFALAISIKHLMMKMLSAVEC